MADPSGTESASSAEPVDEASARGGSPAPHQEPEPAHEADATEAPEAPEAHQTDVTEPTEVLDVTAPTEVLDVGAPTEVLAKQPPAQPVPRYTAPSGFDAGSTVKINTAPEPATEVFSLPGSPSARTRPIGRPLTSKAATPQSIPARRRSHSWAWVLVLILVIAALAAVAVYATLWLNKPRSTPTQSQEDLVRTAIQNFDIAVQKGDLAALRSITCGSTRDAYLNYDEQAWADTHARIAAAKEYPVVATIDQVAINDGHAEANVTTFMAYAPGVRSVRSFDLEFRDNQWKICQAPGN
jgi:hypothetical protein